MTRDLDKNALKLLNFVEFLCTWASGMLAYDFMAQIHRLRFFPDELTAALTYNYVGCRLQLAHFSVNFPDRRLEEPFLSAAKAKADQLIELSKAFPSTTIPVSGEQPPSC
jgi:hypothetical protein